MARMRVLCVRRKPYTVFFKYRKLRKNRPREQDFDVWRTSAEVKAGSARFFIPFFMNENNPAAGGRNGTQTKKPFSLEAGENSFFCK